MAPVELWRFFLRVDEARYEAAGICNSQLQRARRGSFVVARAVIAVPHQYAWYARVQPRCHHECHAVLHIRIGAYRDDGISDDANWECEQHDDATESQAVGEDGDDNCEDGGYGVRDD